MNRILIGLSGVIRNRRRAITIVAIILVAIALFGATRLIMATGTETFLSTDSEAYRDFERFNDNFGSSTIVIMITADGLDQLLRPDNLKAMEYVESEMSEVDNVMSATGPAFFMKQAAAQQTGMAALPDDRQLIRAVVMDPRAGEIRPDFGTVLPDEQHALIHVVMEGMYFAGDEVKDLVEAAENVVAEAGFVDVETALTGPPAFMSQIEEMMTRNMGIMFIASAFLMLLILALVFGVRGFFAWRWLPLGMVGLGIIYTFGVSGLLSIPITMVSMAAFPILVGLGVDYSIQLHNRYDEEVRKGRALSDAVSESLLRVGPSIGIAVVAVCFSFIAMLFSPVPMIRDFGLMLLIGVVSCSLVAMFIPLTILYWRDSRTSRKVPASPAARSASEGMDGLVERGLRRLASGVVAYPAVVVPVAVALTVVGFMYDPRIETETNETNMISQDVPAMRDYQTLKDILAGEISLNVLVESDDVASPEVLAWMAEYEDRILTELPEDVCSTSSVAGLVLQTNGGHIPASSEEAQYCLASYPQELTGNLVSPDYRAANLVVGLFKTEQAEVDQLRDLKAQLVEYASDHPADVNVTVTGARALGPDLMDAFTSGRLKMTLIGVGLIFVGLFFLFRFSLLKAFLATAPIGLIMGWSSGIMYASGIEYTALTACLGALILGIGVEYTILLLRRYYEERDKGEDPREAMTTAMARIGRAITASGLTTIGGFAALLAAMDFVILRYFGLMTVIAMSLALLSTLVLLPSMVVWIDSWRDRRRAAEDVA
jgi:hydrophobe/amphiphile efflux-3 (HAE3) family protein